MAAECAELGPRLGNLDVVYHLAARGVSRADHDMEMLQANIVGTYRALTIARTAGGARFVNMGSSGEYGQCNRATEDHPTRPTSVYGTSKACGSLLAEAFSRQHSLPVVILRPFAVYGPFEASHRLVPSSILAGLRGAPIEISSGEQTRDYIHVDDVVDAAEAAAFHPQAPGHIFNLCSGTSTTVKDVAHRIATFTGARSNVLVGTRPHIPGEMWTTSGDPDRARRVLEWSPRVPLDDGLRRTIAWFKERAAGFAEYMR